MNEIRNEPRIKNPLVKAIRELLEHRALWLYLLIDEAEKKGIRTEEFASRAINRCGVYQGMNLVKKGKLDNLKGLKKSLFGFIARKVFEMEIIRLSEDELFLNFHYCPLVKAWQKQNCTKKEIEKLCDIAMCGDRGIASQYNAVLELPKTIARGDSICELRFKKIINNIQKG